MQFDKRNALKDHKNDKRIHTMPALFGCIYSLLCFQYTNVGCSANENLLPPQPQLTQTKFDKKSSQTTGNAISRTERGLSLNVLTTFWQIKIEERENFEC